MSELIRINKKDMISIMTEQWDHGSLSQCEQIQHTAPNPAVTPADARQVMDDVSKPRPCDHERIPAGICQICREGRSEKGDSRRLVHLSDSPFSLISPGPF